MWGANHGETTNWARCSLAALMSGSISPEELAQTVYDCLKPVDAHGRPVAPKVKDGRLSVRNLENTHRPVQGAAAARTSLEAVLLIHAARELIAEELAAFLSGSGKLFALKRTTKERLRS